MQIPVATNKIDFDKGVYKCTLSDVGAEAMDPPAAWWEAELPAPERRTALPHAKLKLPSAQETWNIVKHMVTP